MLTDKRKLPAMHYVYGVTSTPHKCRECSNFRVFEYHNRRYFKCAAYGISNSEATDWRANYRTCGFFNNPMDNWTPLLDQLKHQSKKKQPLPIDGQIGMEEI